VKSEGLVDGLKSIYLDDTPLQNADNSYNFTGVTIVGRTGTQNQSYMDGFAGAEAESPVGVEVTKGSPVVRTISRFKSNSSKELLYQFHSLLNKIPQMATLTVRLLRMALDIQTDGGGYVLHIRFVNYIKPNISHLGIHHHNTVDAEKFQHYSYLDSDKRLSTTNNLL
jgi:predicted phage tail protein